MELINLFADINIKKDDFKYLILLFIIASVICFSKINHYLGMGFNYDVPVYLSNALYYAGINYNILPIYWLNKAPTICFLTSLLFRLGFVSVKSLYLVTAAFEIAGIIGLYVFLKNRFDSIFSFLGCIFFMSIYLALVSFGSGMTDIPAIGVSVWILVFAVLSFNKNYKYFIITSLLFTVGVYIRPTVVLTLIPMFLYFLYKHDIIKLLYELSDDRQLFKNNVNSYLKSEEFRYILISIVLCIVLYYTVRIILFFVFNLPFNLLNSVTSSISGYESLNGSDSAFNTDISTYALSFLKMLSLRNISLFGIQWSWVIFFIIVFGLLLKAFKVMRNPGEYKILKDLSDKSPKFHGLLVTIIIILIAISIIGYNLSYLLVEIAFVGMFALLSSFLKHFDENSDNEMFFIINVSWMCVYFIFISFINIKLPRYLLPVFIPVTYLFVLSLESILTSIYNAFKKDNENLKIIILKIIPIIFIFILLCTTYVTIDTTNDIGQYTKNSKNYIGTQHVSNYLMKFDKNYMDKNITADLTCRYYNWFLKRPTNSINNQFEPISKFDESKSDYLLLNESVKFENYTDIYHYGIHHLYINNNLSDNSL